MSPLKELELLPSESPGSDPGGADILTSFGFFGVDGGGAASGDGGGCCGGCCGGCWDGGSTSLGELGSGVLDKVLDCLDKVRGSRVDQALGGVGENFKA